MCTMAFVRELWSILHPLVLRVDQVPMSISACLPRNPFQCSLIVAGRFHFIVVCFAGVGAVPSPFDCYMTNRGMKTLHLRMERHGSNAMALARALEAHPFVEKVLYPGLPSHPQHEIAKKQCSGFGGMITFYIKVPAVAFCLPRATADC